VRIAFDAERLAGLAVQADSQTTRDMGEEDVADGA
jgi:hypothetical protein